MGTGENKVFLRFNGKSVLELCIGQLIKSGCFGCIAIAVREDEMGDAREVLSHFPGTEFILTRGGDTRQASIRNALDLIPEDADVIAVHDAARYKDELPDISVFAESLDRLQSLDDTGASLAGGFLELLAEVSGLRLKIDVAKQLLNSLRTHADPEIPAVGFSCFLILALCENLFLYDIRSGICRIQNDIVSEIKHLLQCSRGEVEDETHPGRNSFEIPDM